MNMEKICQSCSMPLDSIDILGTERDGSKSDQYCKYCYQGGAFTAPNMSMSQMETLVKMQMEKKNMPSNIITMAVDSLPNLKRWKKRDSINHNL
ncbi:Putative zinc ribbon domain-containing protein [Chitinophaga sp. CF118]|uniref:zinc ribbon domain-containing protein n=1 Tax=Chitinophaga sp. CF118 TaxID=1884367 RepID=UPI0008F36E16|nr:zinc ribbon domain-containing protein [Chitinophaga sp. CF118]SFD88385.1 Putative zinc ribbon domain-containing protein [Chitinophaga sp. CF118]